VKTEVGNQGFRAFSALNDDLLKAIYLKSHFHLPAFAGYYCLLLLENGTEEKAVMLLSLVTPVLTAYCRLLL
jgi:hypothetical protein